MADAEAPAPTLADLAELRVAVWGFGREGRAALAALRKRFPEKHLTLFCSDAEAAQLRSEAHARETPHALDVVTAPADVAALSRFDIIIKSPGISPYTSPVPEAIAAGVRFTTGSALWFAEHPGARTICVTGTKGKSTVTALIAHLLRRMGKRVALAGNIGLPLLDTVDTDLFDTGAVRRAPDWWVIELSSFQTRDFAGAPTVAVINNVYEEHLDWHGTRERYVADKLAIARRARDLVVNAQQAELLELSAAHPRRHPFGADLGWRVHDGAIWRGREAVLPLAGLPLPGDHNAQNVCAALGAIEAAGEDAVAAAAHVATFKPLPHRLQNLGTRDGIDYVNDSIATTPYATLEALRSLHGRAVCVIVGGFERGVDWSAFVSHVATEPPHAIVATGANGARIAAALATIEAPQFTLASAATLDEVLERARELTPRGGAILLSPGAPSFDQYRDYAERGREFARLAGFDPAAIAQIEGLGIA